jgi:hypothetical protein
VALIVPVLAGLPRTGERRQTAAVAQTAITTHKMAQRIKVPMTEGTLKL